MSKIIAGIDPGVKTGLALWDCEKKEFVSIQTCSIIEAMSVLRKWEMMSEELSKIYFEDSRLRTWFEEPKNSEEARQKLQGAGSIKRDCSIWQEFCEYYEIPFETVKPTAGNTKWPAEYFKKITGWAIQTSQHARDAAVLVFGMQ